MKKIICLLFLTALFLPLASASALVNYSAGRIEIDGIQFLQDATNPSRYYYIPPLPRVATTPDGTPQILMVKFIDPQGETSGGLFHVLVTMSLPEEQVSALQDKLKKQVPNAVIAGPVPMKQAKEAGFQVVSSTLTDKGFRRAMITSGRAPLTPGSSAAIAATLTQHGATLLWDSLESPVSDVSIAVSAWYEAKTPAYRAEIHADISTVYNHFSKILNRQKNYSKAQIRKIFDKLVRNGVIEIKILDRLPEDAGNQAMQQLTDLATSKLMNMIFDMETGLTKLPEKEAAVEKGQLQGRRKYTWLNRLFLKGNNPKYITDNQFTLKDRKDINQGVFTIKLERSTVIKVPFNTTGNMSAFYQANKDNHALFRIVNLADPAFQKREIFFRIDGEFADVFEGRMNFVAVNLRKDYQDQPAATGQIIFNREDIRDGKLTKSWKYARLGEKSEKWLNYKYRISWSLRGTKALNLPPEPDKWLTSDGPVITLAPPLERHDIVIDADRTSFDMNGIRSALVEARYVMFRKPVRERIAILRSTDGESINDITLFSDPGKEIEYRVSWYAEGSGTPIKTDWKPLDQGYLVLVPPEVKS